MAKPDKQKTFSKRVNRFLNQNDTITSTETKRILVLLKDAQSQIINDLQTLPQTDWQMFSLNKIKANIDDRIIDMERRLIPEISGSVERTFNYSIDKADELLNASGINTPLFFLDDTTMQATKTLTGELIKTVPIDLRRRVGNTLALGMAQNKGSGMIIDDIIKASDMTFSNAERIARTEIMRTQSIAQERRFKEIQALNPIYLKRWVWSHKPNGRSGHMEAEMTYTANPIPFDQDFMVSAQAGGRKEACQYPRDPSLSAGNSIYCGCIHLLVNPEFAGDLVGVNT